jgi:hypothetical protein
MRTTKSNVESAFTYLCQALGKRIATRYDDVGAWRLDYMPGHGYQIEEIVNEHGGISDPLRMRCMKAEAFYDAAWMTIRALDLKEKS